jgi:hypothetical protein
METPDGKMRLADVSNPKHFLHLIQSDMPFDAGFFKLLLYSIINLSFSKKSAG